VGGKEAKTLSRFNKKLLAEALGQEVPHPEEIIGISTDSRQIKKNELFFAIQGDHFDGHDYVAEALAKGAAAAVVSRLPEDKKIVSHCILVQDCLESLRHLAKAYRESLDIKVIAIGGSNGKTTTKEISAFFLETLLGKDRVFKTARSENSILGVALSLLNIRDEDFAVIEVGIDEPGWMKKHLDLIQPHFGLITSISEEHLDRLQNIETVAQEEMELKRNLDDRGGKFAANFDCGWIKKEVPSPRSLTYALSSSAQVEGLYKSPNQLNVFGVEFQSTLPGKHNAQNILASLCLARLIHPTLDKPEIQKLATSLREFKGEKHRSQIFRTGKDLLIFDDCYNANPASMRKAIQSFLEISDQYERFLILGDMLDLGEQSHQMHRRLLNEISVLDVDHAYIYGNRMKQALGDVPPVKAITHFDELAELKARIQKELRTNQAFLLKGSRSMRLERVLEIFPEQDSPNPW